MERERERERERGDREIVERESLREGKRDGRSR